MTSSPVVDFVEIGFLTLFLPTASEAKCALLHDLAGEFGFETNAEAAERLRVAVRELPRTRRVEIESEADNVHVSVGKSGALEIVQLIHKLARRTPPPEALVEARRVISRHRRPKPKSYQAGDVFAVALGDSSYCFGQVLWDPEGFRAPTCSLLDCRANAPAEDLEEILTSRTLAILHCSSEHLESGRWIVCGRALVEEDPFSGPCGDPRHAGRFWDGLEGLARAWFGVNYWNDMRDPEFYGRFLLGGVPPSPHARYLSREERSKLGYET